MDERETLIRVEQQLQDSIKNQSLILNDLKEIFNKIELESKATTAVRSDLSNHLDMTVVRREENDRRFRAIEEKQKEVIMILNSFKDDTLKLIKNENDKIKLDFEEEKKERIKESQESKIFQKQIQTSIGLIKWIVGFLFIIISTIWPILTFFFKKP
jgi:uncharacterized membrane protein